MSKADRVTIEILRGIVFSETNLRQVQPAVDIDVGDVQIQRSQGLDHVGRQITFAARVDPADRD
jgi:hypothetical protein